MLQKEPKADSKHQQRELLSLNQQIGMSIFFFFSNFYFPASGQAVVTGVVPSPPRFLPSIFIAHTKGSAIPLLVDF